jgi:hypothetical protein
MALNYITYDDDINKPPISDIINKVSTTYTEAVITTIAEEAETYIESKLLPLGYTRAQLITCPFVDDIMLDYTRYLIIRDIHKHHAPSGRGDIKSDTYKEDALRALNQILDKKAKLYDSSGDLIAPSGGDARQQVKTTTGAVDRIITLQHADEPEDMSVDDSNYTDDTIGEGGAT